MLKDNRYFIESESMVVIDHYRNIEVFEDCWMNDGEVQECTDYDEVAEKNSTDSTHVNGLHEEDEEDHEEASEKQLNELLYTVQEEEFDKKWDKFIKEVDHDEDQVKKPHFYRLEINPKKIDKLKKERTLMSAENKFKYMLTQEYDYKKVNEENPRLEMSMKTTVKIRPYQEKALSRMFVAGRARSGIIVLPCGAGKTLVGISAINRVKKRTLVLCINNITVK